MAASTPADRLYASARASAVDSLGGPRAWNIAAPTHRRHALSAAVMTMLYLQDEQHVSDATVRALLADMQERITNEGATDWL